MTATIATQTTTDRFALLLDRASVRDRKAALRILNRPTITGAEANARQGVWNGLAAIDED